METAIATARQRYRELLARQQALKECLNTLNVTAVHGSSNLTATAAHRTTHASDVPFILADPEAQSGALVPRRRGRNGCRRDPGTSGSADVEMLRSISSFRHCATVTLEDVSRCAPGGEPLWQAAHYSQVSKAVTAYKHSECAAQSLQECDICWVVQWLSSVPRASIAYRGVYCFQIYHGVWSGADRASTPVRKLPIVVGSKSCRSKSPSDSQSCV